MTCDLLLTFPVIPKPVEKSATIRRYSDQQLWWESVLPQANSNTARRVNGRALGKTQLVGV